MVSKLLVALVIVGLLIGCFVFAIYKDKEQISGCTAISLPNHSEAYVKDRAYNIGESLEFCGVNK